ncbi:hypothetical protein [Kibdelosporangium phytohabitans]|uniref:hypothetical protein n=1 Tax=Kibdelosporangium phytohabitans TaxID=860235 RepID=UPI0012F8FF63|nr:hypothetical protein [Kibdelosporangium phytohabitans]MBE1464101.1 hypothetical protein [Kibdelosporangium phytohabitans]
MAGLSRAVPAASTLTVPSFRDTPGRDVRHWGGMRLLETVAVRPMRSPGYVEAIANGLLG